MGRFTVPDRLWASVRKLTPQSWNRYSYAYGDPIGLYDPTGLIARTPAGTCPDIIVDGVEYGCGGPWGDGNIGGRGDVGDGCYVDEFSPAPGPFCFGGPPPPPQVPRTRCSKS